MQSNAVIRSEWIKMRSLRSTLGSLAAVVVVTVGISALVCGLGEGRTRAFGPDPLAQIFYGLSFGQIAAISVGALAMSQEFHHLALRITLAAVPRRGQFYLAKMAVVGGAVLIIGLLTGLLTLVIGHALLGGPGDDVWGNGGLRAVVGSGAYLALMALLAAGLTAVFRSGVAVLSLLIPLILIVPFVFNDVASGVVAYLPDQAGRLLVQQHPDGPIGPWAALGVTALWALAALLAGWLAIDRRDA